uniref:MFS domain-containing protein n=1 Tax=Macrostomum lignano TaxID=282301 RepID=A0A1I8FPB2_9PLAT
MYTMTQVVWRCLRRCWGFMTSLISERFGRALSGLHNGLTIPMTSMYVTEIVPIRLRGRHRLQRAAVNHHRHLRWRPGRPGAGAQREKYWVVAIALSGLPSLVSSIALPLLPRVPGDEAAAKQAVQRFCAPAEVDEAMLALRSEKVKMEQQEAAEKFSIGTLFTSKPVPHGPADHPGCWWWCSSSAASMCSAAGSCCCCLCHCVLVSLVALLIVSQFTPKSFSTATATQKALSGVACALSSSSTLSVRHRSRCITVMYISEIFQQKARGAANSVAMGKSLGHFVYLIYIVPVTAGLVFLFFFMPETKNRSTDDIADELSAKLGGRGRGQATSRRRSLLLML